jgi:S1-C subfamily serine protease
MFGFEINYSMAPGTFLVLISNAMDSPEKRRSLEAMSQQLRSLLPDRRNAFTVGLAFDAEGTQVVLSHVVPDSPAERDGLVVGDVLLAIAGRSLRDHDPLDILSELLTQGNAIDFDIERDGTPQTVRVTPMRRQ